MAFTQNQILQAKDLNVYFGPSTARKLVGCATDGGLSITVNTTSTRTKCSGNTNSNRPTYYEWEVTATVLAMAPGDTGRTNPADLIDATLSLTLAHVAFKTTDNTVVAYEGDAWITSIKASGGTDDNLSFDITFTGEGALTKIAAQTT